jgi:hypothetical protein
MQLLSDMPFSPKVVEYGRVGRRIEGAQGICRPPNQHLPETSRERR